MFKRYFGNATKKQIKTKIVLIAAFLPLIIATFIGLGIGNHFAFNVYDSNITAYLCNPVAGNNESIIATKKSGNELSREIEREGAVLVKNDGTLPLDKSINKVNVFGHSSIDWYYSGGGSGAVNANGEIQYNVPTALMNNGVEYNHDLYNFYTNFRGPLGGNNPNLGGARAETICVLAEPTLSSYGNLLNSAKSFSNTAIMCISRKAGETEDIPHAQYKYNADTDFTRGYLTISTEEEALLEWICDNFENVIVLINSTNLMQLDFLDRIEKIDACLICGCTGNYGANGIVDIIYGEVSPSGKTTDTYPYKLEYEPSYYRGGYEYINNYEGAPSSAWPYNRNYKDRNERKVFYVDYIEGIYVGYKWYETADVEGFWDGEPYNGYENVVQFPFGFGMSYTTFSWELEETSLANGGRITSNKDEITVKVKVTNTGNFKGKDVVEIYMTPPYYNGQIEKAHVNLVGFMKSPELESGQSVSLTYTIRVSDFESYDCYDKNNNGHVGYELDQGEYIIKFMEDSHTLKEMNTNTLTYHIDNTINVDVDEVTGQKVTNIFTGEKAIDGGSSDGSTLNQNVDFMTRENFVLPTTTQTNRNWNMALEVSPTSACINTYSTTIRDAWDNKTGNDGFGNQIPTTNPSWGSGSGSNKVITGGQLTELGRILADPENWNDDENWNKILDQISWDEAIDVINTNSLSNDKGIPSAGRPDGNDADGPQQIGAIAGIGSVRGTAYPCITVTGQTWSTSLAYQMGKSYGKDMQAVGRSGAYAFGANIHRSAYTGRNFEYFSEDGFLSGKMASNASKGVAVTGKYCFMKHFAVNDQEYHRVGLYTWVSEQAIREIYLKPFKECVLYGELSALMTSFNRIGSIWAGGSEALITGVLRNERQFHGMIVTDYCESSQLMDQAQAVRAGSDYGMNMHYTSGVSSSLPNRSSATPRFQWRMKDVCKEIIYGYIHPLLVNFNYNESADEEEYIIVTSSKNPWEWWRPTLVSIDVAIGGGLLFCLYLLLRPIVEPEENGKEGVE
ncbi:MAG: glycoside hydrolase family 3 C-terminal domain-containing protein [Bacilli bacterium]|nr:glycoside hydrolase family 3 C-terminal domain-containing protein [Bacilli bacterium]